MHKTIKKIILSLIAVLLVSTVGIQERAFAKNSSYEFLYIGETPVKVGKYYLKCSVKNGRENIYMSRKKNQAYKETPLTKWICCNGKQAYYTENGGKGAYLYKFNLSSGKKTKVKKLGSGEARWTVSAVYKSNIYITKSDEYNLYREDTYMYNIKKGKLSEIKKNCAIAGSDGEYAVSCDAFRSDISPYPVSLWKLTSSGMKKVKRLAKWGAIPDSGTFIKNKIYYVSYPDVSNIRKAVLYQCSRKGTNKRKIATFETSNVNGVFINDVTEKYCLVYMEGAVYKYVYKSGKMKRIRSIW